MRLEGDGDGKAASVQARPSNRCLEEAKPPEVYKVAEIRTRTDPIGLPRWEGSESKTKQKAQLLLKPSPELHKISVHFEMK